MKTKSYFALIFPVLLFLASCSPFSKMAAQNQFGREDALVLVSNEALNLRSLTYADFDFARNRRELKKITSEKPAFRDVLLYARTYHPPYDYYLLLNAKAPQNPDYVLRDTLITGNKITLAISKKASEAEVKFISGKISALEIAEKR